jgi:hypothetical protein
VTLVTSGKVQFLPQRLDDRRHHEAFDVGPGRVVGAELVPLDRVQGAFQECPKDGGLDLLPLVGTNIDEQLELIGREGEGFRVLV